MRVITVSGNIGKSAELRSLSSGDQVANFSVAQSDGRDKPATWFECSIFGKRGEKLCEYLTKGSKVTVTGTLTVREHDGKTYLGCRVNEVALQGKPSGQSGERDPNAGMYSDKKKDAPADDFDLDDDIPF
jgi:single-strand DNA-binding protein